MLGLNKEQIRTLRESQKEYNEKMSRMLDIMEAQSNSGLKLEWGGTMLCHTSDGRTVNMADELNRREREKNE